MTSLFGGGSSINVDATGTLVPQQFTPIDGQTVFTITAFQYTINTNSLLVFINGVKQRSGVDFLESSSTTFTLTSSVLTTDSVEIIGFPLSTITQIEVAGAANADIFSGNGVSTVFNLGATPGVQANLRVSIAGLVQRPGIDYTWTSGAVLTFTVAPPAGVSNILVTYMLGIPIYADGQDRTLGTVVVNNTLTVNGYPGQNSATIKSTDASAVAIQNLYSSQITGDVLFDRFTSDANVKRGEINYNRTKGAMEFSSQSRLELIAAGATRLALDEYNNLCLTARPSNLTIAQSSGILLAASHMYDANGALYIVSQFYLDSGGQLRSLTGQSGLVISMSGSTTSVQYIPGVAQGSASSATDLILQYGRNTPLRLQGGNLSSGAGIAFPATQFASTDPNTLDDYEEGTFTPVLAGAGTAGVGTYTRQFGRYVKIGNTVTLTIGLSWTAHTGTGSMLITGLPFTAINEANNYPVFPVASTTLTFTGQLFAYGAPNTASLTVSSYITGAGNTVLSVQAAGGVYTTLQYTAA